MASVFGVSNAESCCAAGKLKELLHIAGQQDFLTLLAFTGELVSGKFIPCRSQECPFLMAVSLQQDPRPSCPTLSKPFTDGSQAAFLDWE